MSQREAIIFGGKTETAKVRTRDPAQKVDCKKRTKEATRGCSLLFFFLRYYSPPSSALRPLPFLGRWPSFSIAAIFVYGTSRRRKRGRSDDEEASARGGCGRESEDVRPWGGRGRLENRWRGSADSSLARMENG